MAFNAPGRFRCPGIRTDFLLLFFGANTDKSVLQGGPPEVALSGTTFSHPDWGRHDHHMPDLVILLITRCH